MRWRVADDRDLDLLAEWNHQLISDEGHRNSMNVSDLRMRMKKWFSEDYTAVVFKDDQDKDVGYALYREYDQQIYLRQFFVRRDRRREGLGASAMTVLREELWSPGLRLTVDVLTTNKAGIEFWKSMGYQDYCLTLEIVPDRTATNVT